MFKYNALSDIQIKWFVFLLFLIKKRCKNVVENGLVKDP